MAIVQNLSVAPVVSLPATGIDPTAATAAGAAQLQAVAPVVEAAVQAAGAAPAPEVAQPQPEAAPTPENAGNAAADATATGTAGATAGDAAQAGATASAPAPELTASEKLAAKITAKKKQLENLAAEVARLEAQYNTADLLDAVAAGSVIVARVGRADTAKEVQAAVVGVSTLPNGDKRYKVFYGEGVDSELVVIQSSQIINIISNPAPAA